MPWIRTTVGACVLMRASRFDDDPSSLGDDLSQRPLRQRNYIAGDLRKALLATAALLIACACTGCGSSGKAGPGVAASRPTFVRGITNPWFPLKPGTTFVYTGEKDGKKGRDIVRVTSRTRTIRGAPCTAVDDRLYLNGRLAERTTDWYTQDSAGNVWYFGEATGELSRTGKVTSREGSWLAGVHGAEPGIFMTAHPKLGRSYRQEYYRGQAEDHFEVV